MLEIHLSQRVAKIISNYQRHAPSDYKKKNPYQVLKSFFSNFYHTFLPIEVYIHDLMYLCLLHL